MVAEAGGVLQLSREGGPKSGGPTGGGRRGCPTRADGEISAAARGTYLGGSWIRSILAGCAVWPGADVDDDFFDPVRADVPALMISGAADPVTRPRWADGVARRLPRARHVVVPAGGSR